MYCDTLDNVLPLQVWQTNGSIHKIKIYAGRGQYDEALKMADKAMELAAVDQQRLNEIRRLKMDILAKTGQADELLKLALYTIDTNDSLYRKDIAYQIDELRTKYDVDKQDREMKYMWRYLYILGIVLIIILLLWRWHSWIVNRKNRSLMQQIREMDMLFAERELDTPVISEMNEGKDNKGDTLFARLNRLIKEKRIFAQQDASRVYVAEQLGVSDRTLYRCIKSNTNLTFSDYLAYMRLAYARELLANSENKFTMEKIAMDAGFRSTTTFYRQFKDKYDITPDEFRKLSSKFYPQITVDEQT
jgi:AraC-like DNA-binding protein